jgi:hypothetical protein
MERNIEKRAAFTFRMGIMYSPEQFVFVDECSADRRMGRGYGYALRAAELFESHSLFEEGGKVFRCFSIGFLIRYVC